MHRTAAQHRCMIVFAALLFIAVLAAMLWYATRRGSVDAHASRRTTAGFAGILIATIIGLFLIALGGIAENPPDSRWPYRVDIPVLAGTIEGVWVVVTCGIGRRATMPSICALMSIGLLLWGALA